MTQHYRAALFDMDGLLLDTEQVYTDVTNEIVGEYGKVFDWSIKQHCIGRASHESADYICETLALPIDGATYLRRREPLLKARFAEVQALPGAVNLVTQLHQAGIPIAVATSSDEEIFAIKTRHHDWFRLFDAIVTASHPEVTRAKPAPDIFLTAARQLSIKPADCLVFEDAPSGLTAATTAGMSCVCVPDANMNKTRYTDAMLVLDSLADFPAREWFVGL